MLRKWEKILSNWIHCYTNNVDTQAPVNIDSLLDIISDLRDNFNLDVSKSSLLEAHSVNEFILEKYPHFLFDNGTTEPVNETEIQIAASLLLFFVCVNSKDMDLKSAMCKRLSVEDQELILKFSKCLMECPNVTCADVLLAIKEACGQDDDVEDHLQFTVPETPPAFRGLHNEVRNLQAAVEAERFDRNYLQDELNRTNMKLEKLKTEKEQYKLEIVDLKAKICCGENNESNVLETSTSNSGKLLKQIEKSEQQLLIVQEELDDLRDERDVLKEKLEESRREYDKLIAVRQEQASRVSQLEEEIETERCNSQTLRELVAELRQHNRLNGLDTSQLECDEMDTSIHLPQNSSICSEACANVIEVQLGEERAKIIVLNGQIEMLQDQLNEINKIYIEEKSSLTNVLTEKENEVKSLRDRIDYEREEKNAMKLCFDNEINRMSSDLNYLEEKLKETNEASRNIIESKLQDIQILQEEKLSLLNSLTNETTKLENVIKNLQFDIDTEKSSKQKMREEYENKIMKLNEKVLNRSNELIELQNKIEEKGEVIEKLQMELRQEKQLKDETANKHNNDIMNNNIQIAALENNLRQKLDELNIVERQLQDIIGINAGMKKDIDYLNSCAAQLQGDKHDLEEENNQLMSDKNLCDISIKQLESELEIIDKSFKEMQNTLTCDLNESQATIETLKSQLQDEIEYKLNVQKRLSEIESLLIEKDNRIKETETRYKEIIEKLNNKTLDLDEENKKLVASNVDYDNKIKELTQNGERRLELLNNDVSNKCEIIKSINEKLAFETSLTNSLKDSLKQADQDKNSVLNELQHKVNEIDKLKTNVSELSKTNEENTEVITSFKETLQEKTRMFDELQKDFNTETTRLANKLNETDKMIKGIRSKTDSTIEKKQLKIQALKKDINNLSESLQIAQEKQRITEQEKELLNQKLNEENEVKSKFEKEYLNKCSQLDNTSRQLNEATIQSQHEISSLNDSIQRLQVEIKEKNETVQEVELKIADLKIKHNEVVCQKDIKLDELTRTVSKLEILSENKDKELKDEIDKCRHSVESIQHENVILQNKLTERIVNHEATIKQKDNLIEGLENKLHDLSNEIETLKLNYATCEETNTVKDNEISSRNSEIEKLKEKVCNLETLIQEKENVIHNLNIENNSYKENLNKLNKEIISLRQKCADNTHGNNELKGTLATEKAVRDSLESEKKNLLEENQILLQKTLDDQTAYKVLENERNCLFNEKNILIQELLEEKSVRKLIDDEKEKVFFEFNSNKKILNEEIACLTQQLTEEILAKNILEEEKLHLTEVKMENEEKMAAEILSRMQLKKHNDNLIIDNKNLSDQLLTLNEKKKLFEQEIENTEHLIVLLKQELMEFGKIKEVLLNDNTILKSEKEVLIQSLNETKIALDEIKTEKSLLEVKFNETDENYKTESINTQEEIQNLMFEINNLKTEYKKLRGAYDSIDSILNLEFSDVTEKVKSIDVVDIKEFINVDNSTISSAEKFKYILSMVNLLIQVVGDVKTSETSLRRDNVDIVKRLKDKELRIIDLKQELENITITADEKKTKLSHQVHTYSTALEAKNKDIQVLQTENQSLNNELSTAKIQLDEKVHSLKDKLIDNENLTDKLKKTYECQIDNLNMMVTKLTNYLMDKTNEVDAIRKEKEQLLTNIDENIQVIKTLEEEVKLEKHNQEKLFNDFESERLVLKNMVTVTESIMEDQKLSSHKSIASYEKTIDTLQQDVTNLKDQIETEKGLSITRLNDKDSAMQCIVADLCKVTKQKEAIENEFEAKIKSLHEKISDLNDKLQLKDTEIQNFVTLNKHVCEEMETYKIVAASSEEENSKIKADFDKLKKDLNEQYEDKSKIEHLLLEKVKVRNEFLNEVVTLEKDKQDLIIDIDHLQKQVKVLTEEVTNNTSNEAKLTDLLKEKTDLINILEQKTLELETQLQSKHTDNKQLRDSLDNENIQFNNKFSHLQDEGLKREKEIATLQTELKSLLKEKEEYITKVTIEKDAVISELNKQLNQERNFKQKCLKEMKDMTNEISELRSKLVETKHDLEAVNVLRKENEELFKLVGQRETFVVSQEKSQPKHYEHDEKDPRQNQVDSCSSDTHSSMESYKTITDLEKIVQDKCRTITTLQTDVTFLKTLIAESENRLLDVSKDLDMSKENCQQLSAQLKKIVYQKNEEIAELKKQVSKMSATETRATQIVKLSAKYQAMILKRVAEIKSNTILKELTNFGNSNSCDNELRRNLNAGTITMEELENFLETTDKHLRRCAEKQIAWQKERDRLCEVNRINESEIINLRKFLTELSVSVKTFNSVRDLYSQKLSRVISIQRTVRREILNLDGQITDATMCKLERGYAAVIQDLSECAMNLERWVERSIGRTISSEKIKQAFTSEMDRVSLASTSFQNTSLDVQLEELENSFQKLLQEVQRAQSGEGARDPQAVTVMEVRAEYEDKLNRMKSKMKQLYQEQITIFKDKQKEELAGLERELLETKQKLEESSQAYQKHIRGLTTELWNVGEKFLVQKGEAEWLRKTQRSGSLMSLQHVHSAGLVAPPQETHRQSDTHSLRSLRVNQNKSNNNNAKESRGVHMSDEEELFDNRWLRELDTTPRQDKTLRLSELRWRNSLCPPHLKSSYPAETQFTPTLHEEDIKCAGTMSLGARAQRKEVGITAYKKPGPPTPSKQAGRLSATDSELRESLRVEADPSVSQVRKTSTPSRLRALFRTNKPDAAEGTPRSRRLSHLFRKK